MLLSRLAQTTEGKLKKEPTDASEYVVLCEDSVISAEVKRKQKPKLMEQNSCPQHQLPEEMPSSGVWFPPTSLKV